MIGPLIFLLVVFVPPFVIGHYGRHYAEQDGTARKQVQS